MFVDIAIMEAEQASIAGLRTGQKSRAKNDALTANMYPCMMPDLYGEDMTLDPNNTWIPGTRACMFEAIAGTVEVDRTRAWDTPLVRTEGTPLLPNS